MPMDSDQVLAELDKLAATNSQNAKGEMLKPLLEDPLFARVCDLACNSFITFGIKDAIGKSTGAAVFGRGTFDFLDNLASRRLTGGAAKANLASWYDMLSPASAELLWRILNKDLRCAVTSTILNKVKPGFIPVFEVMLAHKFEEKRILGRRVVAEPKKDGVRVTALVANGECRFLSRTGKPFPALDHLGPTVVRMVQLAFDNAVEDGCEDLIEYLGDKAPAVVLDGEMVSGDFNKTVGDVRRKSVEATDAVFEVFDAIPYNLFMQHEVIDIGFERRRDMLEKLVLAGGSPAKVQVIEQKPVKVVYDCADYYMAWRDQGFEGAMIKDLDAPYKKSRSYAWLKMKAQESEDLRVVGAFEGQGKYVGSLGGLIVDFNGVEVRVGGGFSDEQRNGMWHIWAHERGDIVGRLIEVEYHEVTKDGSLRHPRFVRFRDDKDEKIAA